MGPFNCFQYRTGSDFRVSNWFVQAVNLLRNCHRAFLLGVSFLVPFQFHGYGSGKKKQEKRLKQVEEEKKKEQTMDMKRLK